MLIMADEKFILTSLDDLNLKQIADVLGNKTCKKILEFLAETREASEQDIAKALEIPINTVEYNLKKLLETGLVKKTKNFFWSRKGKKIDMYKLARKHIVISSKSSKPSINKLKSVLPVAIVSGFLALIVHLSFRTKFQVESAVETATRTFDSSISKAAESVGAESTDVGTNIISEITNNFAFAYEPGFWFLSGALAAVVIFLILNWRKIG